MRPAVSSCFERLGPADPRSTCRGSPADCGPHHSRDFHDRLFGISGLNRKRGQPIADHRAIMKPFRPRDLLSTVPEVPDNRAQVAA
jgi:hypothetical protein